MEVWKKAIGRLMAPDLLICDQINLLTPTPLHHNHPTATAATTVLLVYLLNTISRYCLRYEDTGTYVVGFWHLFLATIPCCFSSVCLGMIHTAIPSFISFST